MLSSCFGMRATLQPALSPYSADTLLTSYDHVMPIPEIPDFSVHREPHRFTVDGEDFAAPAVVSPVTLKRIAAMHATMTEVTSGLDPTRAIEMIDAIGQILEILIPGQGGRRLRERILSEEEPLDLQNQALPIMFYLLECYGLRPTVPSSVSPTGLTESTTATPSDGTSSTDGVGVGE